MRLYGVADAKGVCFVEVGCGTHPVGPTELKPYLARPARRDPRERGLYIASEDYTAAGIELCTQETRRGRTVILCTMREIYGPMIAEFCLDRCIDDKVAAATVDGEPWYDTTSRPVRGAAVLDGGIIWD